LLVQDSYELRKKLLIHVLKCHSHEVDDNIPNDACEYLSHLKGEWLLINER
jgi:hypothetical protein